MRRPTRGLGPGPRGGPLGGRRHGGGLRGRSGRGRGRGTFEDPWPLDEEVYTDEWSVLLDAPSRRRRRSSRTTTSTWPRPTAWSTGSSRSVRPTSGRRARSPPTGASTSGSSTATAPNTGMGAETCPTPWSAPG
ncbi:hypothetical protein NKG05_23035 [Oerskovia sp. M15]